MGGKGVSDENIALTAMKEEIDSYGSTTRDDLKKSVRFQVVVWYVGPIGECSTLQKNRHEQLMDMKHSFWMSNFLL